MNAVDGPLPMYSHFKKETCPHGTIRFHSLEGIITSHSKTRGSCLLIICMNLLMTFTNISDFRGPFIFSVFLSVNIIVIIFFKSTTLEYTFTHFCAPLGVPKRVTG